MGPEPVFVQILKTQSLTDIASIKSILDAEGINYYLQGENMVHLIPFDSAILMVADTDAKKAIELLKPLQLKYTRIILPE